MKNILKIDFSILIFLMPVTLYLFLLFFWHINDFYNITGDEPHYLITVDSIVNDFDLKVQNNYQQETLVSRSFGGSLAPHAYYSPSGYSIHGIGIAILLAFPYYIAGVIGTKIFLAVLFGISIPFISYKIVSEVSKSKRWSTVISLAFSCSLPFYAASNQIFPDLITGVIITYATYCLILCEPKRKSVKSWIILLLLISFLPWLRMSFILPFSILTFYSVVLNTRRVDGIYEISNKLLFLIPVLSVVLIAFYNKVAFQNFLNPYGKQVFTFTINEIGLAFLGLVYDQKQGSLLQNPLLIIGFFGLFLFYKNNKNGLLLVLSLYVSINLPNSMLTLPSLYGGLSFVGRFAWSSIGLWLFPLAYAVRLALSFQSIKLNRILIFLMTINMLTQVSFYRVALTYNHFLYNTNIQNIENTTNNLYKEVFLPVKGLTGNIFEIEKLLPYYHDLETYASHPPNYLFLMLSMSLIYIGKICYSKTDLKNIKNSKF